MTDCICRPYPVNGEPVHSIECLKRKHRADLADFDIGGTMNDYMPDLTPEQYEKARQELREELENTPATKLDVEEAKGEAYKNTREMVRDLREYVIDLRTYRYTPHIYGPQKRGDEGNIIRWGPAIAIAMATLALTLSLIAIST